MPGVATGAMSDAAGTWRPLRFFNLYRTVLAGLFVVLTLTGAAPRSLGRADQDLFLATAAVYLLFSLLGSFSIRLRWPAFGVQVFSHVFADIIAITLMMLASGGVRSGFGMLLVVAIAGGSILTAGRTGVLFAAIATLAVLAQEIYATLQGLFPDTAYTQSGMLGATFFATAFLAHVLARRVRESEALAQQRGVDLANLSLLNEHIIQRMQSGILAVDADGRVALINESAQRMLGYTGRGGDVALAGVCPRLAEMLQDWRRGGLHKSRFFRPEGTEVDVIASFAALDRSAAPGTLVFLEDSSAFNQRAQQLKLASLGRLTASIAHEIRNPLGAISHAGQLLAESPQLAEQDRRLTRIIDEQSRRLNAMVENVMQLGRRKPHAPESIRLLPWLQEFVAEITRGRNLAQGDVTLRVDPGELEVRIDPSQLHQIIHNLADNGLRYAGERPLLQLRAAFNGETERVYLDVCDSGPGVPEHQVQHLFEPFFTTERTGTGLGLYITRELCEVNQASLNHLGLTEHGHCFRITFAHPSRHQITAT